MFIRYGMLRVLHCVTVLKAWDISSPNSLDSCFPVVLLRANVNITPVAPDSTMLKVCSVCWENKVSQLPHPQKTLMTDCSSPGPSCHPRRRLTTDGQGSPSSLLGPPKMLLWLVEREQESIILILHVALQQCR